MTLRSRHPSRITPAERQALQAQIARARRRLERNVGRAVDRSLMLGSWSEYVREHPARSLLAATGVGMAFSGLLSRIPLPGKAAERFADFAMGAGWSKVLAEVQAAFERFQQKPANDGGPL